jgi:MYXO-CTERM domain-containing protein
MKRAMFLAVAITCAVSWRAARAANVCDETPPADRQVDGIPAYAQCDASRDASIYSNNGVDTATAAAGSDWIRTQSSGGYQCTEFAKRYLRFRWGLTSTPRGNAGTWCDGTIPAGLVSTTTPVHGDVLVFPPGSCGASSTTGHVAVVDIVNGDGTVWIVEQNGAKRRRCAITCAKCFLHVAANDGAASDGGIPDAAVVDGAAPDIAPADTSGARSDAEARLDSGRRRDAAADARRDGGSAGTGGTGGSAGTGGAGASAGSGGAGASAGSGGAAGTAGDGKRGDAGGPGGAAGSSARDGGTGGGAGSPAQAADTGCACRLGGSSTANGAAWLLVALVLVRRWRRRSPRRSA